MVDKFEVEVRNVDDASRTFMHVVEVLDSVGFKILSCDKQHAELSGPGLNSTKQNPLLGASAIQLRCQNDSIKLGASLGGVATMERFLRWFPLGLGFILGTLFAVLGGFGFGRAMGVPFGVPWAQGFNWVVVAYTLAFLPVCPWFLIGPWMVRMIRKRTTAALEALLQNAVMKAKLS
ncbi:MAG: hypothetical protein JNK90_15400 [Planctomycetaceae bacterium]|nr:hypothetical protein [Planctomycetaceae bacterium]